MGERNAAQVGAAILQGFAKGRARANAATKEQAALNASVVAIHINADRQAGKPVRGRAGRISRKLRGVLSERLVRKIIAALQMSGADSLEQSERHTNEGGRS